jgi:hypothetical protein
LIITSDRVPVRRFESLILKTVLNGIKRQQAVAWVAQFELHQIVTRRIIIQEQKKKASSPFRCAVRLDIHTVQKLHNCRYTTAQTTPIDN